MACPWCKNGTPFLKRTYLFTKMFSVVALTSQSPAELTVTALSEATSPKPGIGTGSPLTTSGIGSDWAAAEGDKLASEESEAAARTAPERDLMTCLLG